jgi:DNA-binding CsgD family transcriptional regulator
MIRSQLRRLLEPALGTLLFLFWLAGSSSQIVDQVPSRTDTSLTNPYAVLIAAGFSLAIAVVRVRPGAALSVTGGLLLVQFQFWPTRFSQTSWVAYLLLVVVVVGVSAYGEAVLRRLLLGLSIVFSIAVSALLNVPLMSLSGVWGTINGKDAASIEVLQGFLSWAVVGILLTWGAWRIGVRLRPPTAGRGRDAGVQVLPDVARVDDASSVVDSARLPLDIGGLDSIAALSVREKEIFLLAARGLSNSDIARSANIGESTVKTHLSSILTKLGFTSRSQIVAQAYQSGMLR